MNVRQDTYRKTRQATQPATTQIARVRSLCMNRLLWLALVIDASSFNTAAYNRSSRPNATSTYLLIATRVSAAESLGQSTTGPPRVGRHQHCRDRSGNHGIALRPA